MVEASKATKSKMTKIKQAFHSYWHDFTSIEGIAQYKKSHSTIGKVFWMVLFIAGFGLTIANLLYILMDYAEKNVVTNTRLYSPEMMEFPAVTICNENVVHCGRLNTKINTCTQEAKCPEDLANLCKLYVLGDCKEAVVKAETAKYGKVLSDLEICSDTSLDTHGNILDYYETLYANLSLDSRREIAHSADQMIKYCSHGVEDHANPKCKEMMSGEHIVHSRRLQFCYTFNANNSVAANSKFKPLSSYYSGHYLGLVLHLDLESQYYMSLTGTQGIGLYIHHPDEIPFLVSSIGYRLLVNKQASISLEKKMYTRQPPPFTSKCSSNWGYLQQIVLPGIGYQSRLCTLACFDNFIQEKCGCGYIMEAGIDVPRMCQQETDSIDYQCYNKFLGDPPNLPINCTCSPNCLEHVYDGTISYTTWPSSNSWGKILNIANVTLNGTKIPSDFQETMDHQDVASIKNHFKSNHMQVKVFFKDKTVMEINESPKYTYYSIMSSIGGAASLYLGVSFIMAFEVFELMFRLIGAITVSNSVSNS